jgi:hypothetical protein
MQLLIDKATRHVLASGAFPTPPADPNVLCVDITDKEAAKLAQSGSKTLGADGTLTVTPPPAPTPDPHDAKRGAAITALKTAAGGTGAMATLAQAMLDLHGIS